MPSAPAPALFRGVTPVQRRTLLAAALGWMLDAFDVMLYAMVIAYIMRDLGITKAQAGLLNTLTLLASGIGGVLFGFIADRVGRARALMFSILTYSVFSFASGLSTSLLMLACFRFLLGLGMGGEWNTGAALVAETWPNELRARALSVVQSSWAIGYAAAALVSGILLHRFNWRAVFFVGILPAFVTLWIRKDVPEPELWKTRGTPAQRNQSGFAELFSAEYLRSTLALLFMNFFGLFAWWGLFTWIPPYLSLPVSQGGRGFSVMNTTGLLVFLNLAGMFPGYLSFGWFADRLGRKRAFPTVSALRGSDCASLCSSAKSSCVIDSGRCGRFLWHRLLLRIRNYWERNLPHSYPRPGAWLHLQRRAHLERTFALRDRPRRPDSWTRLRFLPVRSGLPAVRLALYPVAGNQGKKFGMRRNREK